MGTWIWLWINVAMSLAAYFGLSLLDGKITKEGLAINVVLTTMSYFAYVLGDIKDELKRQRKF